MQIYDLSHSLLKQLEYLNLLQDLIHKAQRSHSYAAYLMQIEVSLSQSNYFWKICKPYKTIILAWIRLLKVQIMTHIADKQTAPQKFLTIPHVKEVLSRHIQHFSKG